MTSDRNAVINRLAVSRETASDLAHYVAELERWQRSKNLVGPGTLSDVWVRHIEDSAQIARQLGPVRRIVDLGSGAGLPGLVLAIIFKSDPGAVVHLVESNGRKCAFLRHVVRLLRLPVRVHDGRIEAVLPRLIGEVDAITARALAPLSKLLELTNNLLTGEVFGLFPKGQDLEHELTEAAKYWTFDITAVVSCTDSKARILRVSNVRRIASSKAGAE